MTLLTTCLKISSVKEHIGEDERTVGVLRGGIIDNEEKAEALLAAFDVGLKGTCFYDDFEQALRLDDQRAHYLMEDLGHNCYFSTYLIIIQGDSPGGRSWTIRMSQRYQRSPEFLIELVGTVDNKSCIKALEHLGFCVISKESVV
ncbi:MAG: hypothetical protein UZ21_OP11001000900 [Microgenomates bacterium OLB22]|nr:MAG: hypothetical protein UZ21_OP11001000900 [Microgenomates bacterium OLB22]